MSTYPSTLPASAIRSYFGRDWTITVTPQTTGEEWTLSKAIFDKQALRATFEIEQLALSTYWFADISIYNLSPADQQVIQKGDLVSVRAGYQAPGAGLIFTGRVFQPLWEREGATDYKLKLHCFVGLYEDETGLVSLPLGSNAAQISQGDQVRQVAAAAGIPIDYLDPSLDQKKLPRGKPFSGRARLLFEQVARDNKMNCWIGWAGLTIRSLAPQGELPDTVFAPPLSATSNVATSGGLTKYTLIGTPNQTEQGIFFRTLLDPSLSLGQLVKVSAITTKLALTPGQLPIRLDKDGLYVVAGIRCVGDTWGNDWYSEISGVTRGWAQLFGTGAR